MDALDQVLEGRDKKVAAGLLARAALALEMGEDYPNSTVDNDQVVLASLIAEARSKLGFKPDDKSQEAIEQIGSYLDEKSERLAGTTPAPSAFERLIARGDFPSDLYKIRIIPNIREFFGQDFEREKALIERTVRRPSREQHYGVEGDAEVPRLVSLFAREFKTPFPARDFTMLVAGQRGNRQVLEIHMAWRIYASQVRVDGASDLVELLRRFADVYGIDITINGIRGRFFLTTSEDVTAKTTVELRNAKGLPKFTVTRFIQRNPKTGQMYSSLVMAVDLDRYRATLDHWDYKKKVG